MTSWSSMQAIIFTEPPQRRQTSAEAQVEISALSEEEDKLKNTIQKFSMGAMMITLEVAQCWAN